MDLSLCGDDKSKIIEEKLADGYRRQRFHCCRKRGGVQVTVSHGPGQVGLVRRQIEVAVPAQGRENDPLLAGLTAAQRFLDGGGERMGRFRCGKIGRASCRERV